MIIVRQLCVAYGPHLAIDGVSLELERGEIVSVLGANGAGKSTLLRCIAGLVQPSRGVVLLEGLPVQGLPPHRLVELGVVLVPERGGVFRELTVRENLLLGAHLSRHRQSEAARLDRVLHLFPRLADRLRQVVRSMSGGEQRMVALGRALMTAPRLLLLDEPTLGLSPALTLLLFSTIASLRDEGIAILLVEQNAHEALAVSDRAYVLQTGRIVGSGTVEALRADPMVRRAYLGLS